MKKLFLIVAIVLCSITSAFAYSGYTSGSAGSVSYNTHTSMVSYSLSGTGEFKDIIGVEFNTGSSAQEWAYCRTIGGRFIAPAGGYISLVYMEVIGYITKVYNNNYVTGVGSIYAEW